MALFYVNDELHLGEKNKSVKLSDLIEAGRRPFYVYDLDGMCQQVRALQSALQNKALVHYAVKANSHPLILKAFAELGIGADVVSGGEICCARKAGIPAKRIIFSGVGKTKQEIELALKEGVAQINVESVSELKRIAEIAKVLRLRAPVAFRFNPDVNPETHPYITTGFRENKFGLAKEQLEEFLTVIDQRAEHLHLRGLTLHIGSQLLEINSLREAIQKAVVVFKDLLSRGYQLETFDVGGGVGIDYKTGAVSQALVQSYGQMVTELLKDVKAQILCEPGRVIVAVHGVLLGEIQYLKNNGFRNFAILNTGMHHLARPALYQAYHRILPVTKSAGPECEYDIVGPICESSDVLGRERKLSELKEGDWLAIAEAGAYGMSMASQYNAHELPRELVWFNGYISEATSHA